MRIDVEFSDEATPAIRRFLGVTLPQRRREAVEKSLQEALVKVVELNPVETARSRAAWVNSLEQLEGSPPANWQGPHPSGEGEGRAAGELVRQHSTDQSAATAANHIPYARLLEYGTSHMRPFAMVRRALQQVRERTLNRLRQMFH